MAKTRVVHYVNQFFGGIGGEAAANEMVQVREGAVGPGRVLEKELGEHGNVVATLIGGDNFMAEQPEAARSQLKEHLNRLRPDVVVAGPAFDSGRYGLACANVCLAAQAIGLPAVTGMDADNPGYTTNRRQLLCVPSGRNVAQMATVLAPMARLALKVGSGQPLTSAAADGYLPRGLRKVVYANKTGAERAADMLTAWLGGKPFTTEIPVKTYDAVAAAPAVTNLADTKLAIVTSGGLVPQGNPDGLMAARAVKAFRYEIATLTALQVGDWITVHGGYSNKAVNERNPNYVVPLDVLRDFERAGRFKSLYPIYFATVGNQTAIADAKRMGQEIAAELLAADVGAVLLVST